MDILPFLPLAHTKHIETWLRAHGLSSEGAYDLPRLGYIVYEKDKPIAAGFLRHMEPNYGVLDSLITNPEAAPELRDQAIDAVVLKLLGMARKLDIPKIMATSSDDHTLLRSKKFGFVELDHKVIVLAL